MGTDAPVERRIIGPKPDSLSELATKAANLEPRDLPKYRQNLCSKELARIPIMPYAKSKERSKPDDAKANRSQGRVKHKTKTQGASQNKEMWCGYCKKTGHLFDDCPNLAKRKAKEAQAKSTKPKPAEKPVSSNPRPRQAKLKGERKRRGECFTCGESGHFQADCPQKTKVFSSQVFVIEENAPNGRLPIKLKSRLPRGGKSRRPPRLKSSFELQRLFQDGKPIDEVPTMEGDQNRLVSQRFDRRFQVDARFGADDCSQDHDGDLPEKAFGEAFLLLEALSAPNDLEIVRNEVPNLASSSGKPDCGIFDNHDAGSRFSVFLDFSADELHDLDPTSGPVSNSLPELWSSSDSSDVESDHDHNQYLKCEEIAFSAPGLPITPGTLSPTAVMATGSEPLFGFDDDSVPEPSSPPDSEDSESDDDVDESPNHVVIAMQERTLPPTYFWTPCTRPNNAWP